MRKLFLTFIFIFSLHQISFADPFFCFPNTTFNIPYVALRAGLSCSFRVNFDVINFEASNFKINSIDSVSYIDLYEKSIIQNIKSLLFLKDTLNAALIINYIITPVWKINQDYAEAISDDEINFVFRGAQVRREIDVSIMYPQEIDTLFIDGYVMYKSGMSSDSSNILVERIFNNGLDTSIIRVNNHPECTIAILQTAKTYTKDYFTRLVPKVKYYYLRFKILREVPECNQRYVY
ncbi:MAG: hypothetical protein Q8M94_18805 [Ignavibacteria bacterium]|nr:hypothetical protein [Ignavibacteria bacterium]